MISNRWIFVIGFILISLSFCHGQAKSKESVSDEKKISKSDVEIVYMRVLSSIQARFATTAVTSYVANRAETSKEITFTVQLPDAAFISNFSIQMDDKVIYGKVKEKEEAKTEFEAAKGRGESTGLVAKAPRDTNAFTISVNIAARSKITFNLTYQEVLKRVQRVYKHIINLQSDQPISELKVDVYITESGEITNMKVPKFGEKIGEKTNKELLALEDEPNVKVKTISTENRTNVIHVHYQPKEDKNGQLVLLYDVKRDKSGGEIQVVNGYFVHFFAPEGFVARPKDIVFVLDKSGSMEGRKIRQLREAMKIILNDLSSNDTFQILFFSDAVEQWRKEFSKATSENVKAAIKYVEDTEANGGTNIYESLQEGLKSLKKSGSSSNVPTIFFLTDGQATVGETDSAKIIDDTAQSNDNGKNVILHGVAFGNDADYGLMQKISSGNRGLARRVYEDSDASIQLEGFYHEISSPLLTELKIDYLNETVDAASIVRDTSHAYYDGSEVVVVGKVNESGKGKQETLKPVLAKISGQGAGGMVNMETRSSVAIVCPYEPWPIWYDERTGDIGSKGGGEMIMRPPIWCCPPGSCCWWRVCHPPPPPPPPPVTLPPKEPLPARTVGGFLERMWAYQTIKKLLKDMDLKESKSDRDEAKRKALDLSLQYHFVTELTSMVVVKPNEDKPDILKSKEKQKSHSEESGGQVPHPAGNKGSGAASAARPFGKGPLGAVGAGFGGVNLPEDGEESVVLPPPPSPSSPPPPPPTSSSATAVPHTTTESLNEISTSASTKSSASGCTMQVIFVMETSSSNPAIPKRVDDYAKTILKLLRKSTTVNSSIGIISAISNGRGFSTHNMTGPSAVTIAGNHLPDQSKINSTLTDVIDSQFGNYAIQGVKRYLVFFITSTSLEYAENASGAAGSHNVVSYAVSFTNDTSSGFTKALGSIGNNPARAYTSPPSTGEDLGNTLVHCN